MTAPRIVHVIFIYSFNTTIQYENNAGNSWLHIGEGGIDKIAKPLSLLKHALYQVAYHIQHYVIITVGSLPNKW